MNGYVVALRWIPRIAGAAFAAVAAWVVLSERNFEPSDLLTVVFITMIAVWLGFNGLGIVLPLLHSLIRKKEPFSFTTWLIFICLALLGVLFLWGFYLLVTTLLE